MNEGAEAAAEEAAGRVRDAVAMAIRCASGDGDIESEPSQEEREIAVHLLSHFAREFEAVVLEDAARLVDHFLLDSFDQEPNENRPDSGVSDETWDILAATCRVQRINDLEAVATTLRTAATGVREGLI